MDFLDPEKTKRHRIILFIGYFFLSIMVILISVLMYYFVNYGYSFNQGGKLIRNGLLFISTQPHPADIYLNDVLNSNKTNKHLFIPEGVYNVKLQRVGYRTWTRSVQVDGGQLAHFDYPLLVPEILNSTKIKTYATTPLFFSESDNHNRLVVGYKDTANYFEVYDISNTASPLVGKFNIPDSVLTNPTVNATYSVVQWSDDNTHVLINRNYGSSSEYIVLDTVDPTQSINLKNYQTLLKIDSVSLNNRKFNQFYLYSSSDHLVYGLNYSDNSSQPTQLLSDVYGMSDYNGSGILYATKDTKDSNLVDFNILFSGNTYLVKKLSKDTNYLLANNIYDSVPYVVLGVSDQNKVYVFKDPIAQIKSSPNVEPVPVQVLAVKNANYVSFSLNKQYIMAENGNQFGVYDIFNDHGYNFTSKYPIDAAQGHAEWMDKNRISYVSSGQVVIFDYDYNYNQLLNKGHSSFQTAFDSSDTYFYKLVQSSDTNVDLYKTSFYTPADQP